MAVIYSTGEPSLPTTPANDSVCSTDLKDSGELHTHTACSLDGFEKTGSPHESSLDEFETTELTNLTVFIEYEEESKLPVGFEEEEASTETVFSRPDERVTVSRSPETVRVVLDCSPGDVSPHELAKVAESRMASIENRRKELVE